jgi:pyrimidine deaminase RibD-like protein
MQKYIHEAEKQADKSNGPFKHGCVAVVGGRIVGIGHNKHTDSYVIRLREKCFERENVYPV